MGRVWRRQIGFVFLCAAMVLVGSTVASKIIGEGMPRFSATALRFAISSPIFAVPLWLSRRRIPSLSGREWGLLLVQAAAGSAPADPGFVVHLAANAGVVLGTLPVVIGLLAIAAFGERLGWRFIAAITIATAGVLVITPIPNIFCLHSRRVATLRLSRATSGVSCSDLLGDFKDLAGGAPITRRADNTERSFNSCEQS